MADLSLQDIREFNSSLRTIHAAGVALHFATQTSSRVASSTIDSSSSESLAESLFALEASVAGDVASGIRPVEALEKCSLAPYNYCQSLLLWSRTDHSPIAFEPITVAAQTKRHERNRLTVSLVQPLIAISFAYCCLAFICTFVAPLFEALSRQTHATAGPFLTALLWLRAWMPVWLLVIPVGILLLRFKPVLFRKRPNLENPRNKKSKRLAVTQADIAGRAQVATFADKLIASGISNSESHQWVRSAVGSQLESKSSPPAAGSLPSLMAWATTDPQSGSASSPADSRLGRAAAIYGASADAMASRGRNLIQPRISFVLCGGLLVLAVALTVFGPLIEMMLFVSLSDGS